MYRCSVCEMPVIVVAGEPPIRACDCVGPIIAEVSSTLVGTSKLAG